MKRTFTLFLTLLVGVLVTTLYAQTRTVST